jgi:hypothetical protein
MARSRGRILTLGSAATITMVSAAAGQTTYHVDDDAAGGDGLDWTTAFDDLQDALDVAVAGDEIRVGSPRARTFPRWSARPAIPVPSRSTWLTASAFSAASPG